MDNTSDRSHKAVLAGHLPRYGIDFSTVHINRLVKAGKFPAPFKLGANRNAWWESEILDWLEGRAATRGTLDQAKVAVARRAAAASVASRAER